MSARTPDSRSNEGLCALFVPAACEFLYRDEFANKSADTVLAALRLEIRIAQRTSRDPIQ